jgi:hypothetical protein|tara:strand:- start:1041 stop:2888 length:1848 start_codon:yes stop_codon:yes gene_type:complete
MPLTKLVITPGIDKENTDTGAEGRWVDCDKVRFRYGLPQKIGGWTKLSGDYYVGVGRELFNWFDLNGFRLSALGTDRKAYIYRGGTIADITPIRATDTLTTTFTTANTSANVEVKDVSHGAGVGDFVTISNVTTSIGGIANTALNAEFEIIAKANTDSYTIQTTGNTATSTVTDTGNCDATYQLTVGSSTQTFGYGWGAGTWGASTWGTPRSTSAIDIDLAQWSFDNWGEDLILTKRNGGTYLWDRTLGMTDNRATAIANAPTTSILSLITPESRHLICMGTETTIGDSASQDKMLIRFSDQENYDQFTANAINTAGSQRLADGSEIRCAKSARAETIVWTDTAVFSMQFIGAPFTFGFKKIGTDCGIIGLNAAIVVDDVAYWMGDDRFFAYAGSVQEIPCSVKNYIFNDINKTQYPQVYAGHNSKFTEIIWYYCTESASQIDRYVTYNYAERVWSIGNLDRGTWIDNGVYQNPLASEYDASSTANTISTIYGLTAGRSLIYKHESGYDADGVALAAHIESGDGDIADGQDFSFVNKFIPDFQNLVGNAQVTLSVRDYPGDSKSAKPTQNVNSTTTYLNTRARGRQISLKIANSELGDNWRLGTMRINIRPDGRR